MIKDYEIGVSHYPSGEFDLSQKNSTFYALTSLGEVALKAYDVPAEDDKQASIFENLQVDIHKANTLIEIRHPGEGTQLGEVIGYISGRYFKLSLQEGNPLDKDNLNVFRIYGAAVIPELQGEGAGQLMLQELLETLSTDALIGETNNPQAVLARLKICQKSGSDWSVVWGNESVCFNTTESAQETKFITSLLYDEIAKQRSLDAEEFDIEPLDTGLYEAKKVINAPDFTGNNEVDPDLLKALPDPFKKVYTLLNDLSDKTGKTYQAPMLSIRIK